ncbi:uncharacterized protein LOC131892866 [Tigriopus californicus]|uniref:uncharacterized protein LOC131892866 n=1 Tax=Tigriopus californicus TaxID=6832 RepID=UPI0027DA979A|nr:uncharacterized protein LOC131892866 [Tigriopus californicus]
MKTLGFCILFFYLLRLGLTLKCNLTDDCQKCTQNPLCVFRIRDGIVQCTTKDEQLNVSHSLADETEIRSLSVKVVDEAMCSLTLEAFFQAIGNEGKSEQDPNDIETTWLGSVPEAVNVTDDFYQPDTSEGMYKALKDAETNFSTTPPRSLFPEVEKHPLKPCGNGFDILAFIAGCVVGIVIFLIGNLCLKSSKKSEARKTYNQPYTFDSFVNP